MDLDSLVKFLLDDSQPLEMRSISLFEFQVSLFYPRTFQKLYAARYAPGSATPKSKSARALAGTQFLTKIENNLVAEKKGGVVSIRELAQDETYCTIHDSVVALTGGWETVRASISAKVFDRNISKKNERAKIATDIIDFAFRYCKTIPSPSRLPKVTSVQKTVGTATHYRVLRSETVVKEHWSPFRDTAVFLYLLAKQDFQLMPSSLAENNFLEVLLGQTKDTVTLRQFFQAYQDVCRSLTLSGYQFEELVVDLGGEPRQLQTPLLPSDALAAFDATKPSPPHRVTRRERTRAG